jgi:deazaflavin-dependent oxidoreductase (nitroreductase family)
MGGLLRFHDYWAALGVVVLLGLIAGYRYLKSRRSPSSFKDHLARYLATDGADGYLWGAGTDGAKGLVPTLLLTTIGRKTGNSLTVPLIFGRIGPSYVVVASKGGASTHPAWYLNLQANPEVRVQVKAEKFTAHARTADAAERATLWPMMVDIFESYAQFQTKTDRQIPVVVLAPI